MAKMSNNILICYDFLWENLPAGTKLIMVQQSANKCFTELGFTTYRVRIPIYTVCWVNLNPLPVKLYHMSLK